MINAPPGGPAPSDAVSSDAAPSGQASIEALAAAASARRLALHWRKTRLATIAFLCVWLLATFGVGIFARQLEQIHFFGWPLSYYMGAQGSLIVFLLIIGGYAVLMRRLDREALGEAGAAPAASIMAADHPRQSS